ncbi:hypothetical protein DSM104299_00739 [Baekduia alba]|uniref:hypothetical protein n=1 Tax=Baekduia alba TaxID=2997333 RepID=UPI0023419B83|nr:hypothetical protein [Baekduia alba]WCB92057.1 hypothetical protein DSM104299_00739 [Baekduia alba]
MTDDPFDLLRDELAGAAARRATTARRRRTFRGRRPLLAVAAALALCGTATAAVLTLGGGEPSPPLTGATPADVFIRRYAIDLSPDLRVGQVGWCTSLVFAFGHGGSGVARGCGPAAPRDAAQIAGGGIVSGLTNRGRDVEFRIVDRRVAAVLLPDGRRVVPRADPRLPFGWRAVVAFVPRHHDRAPRAALTLLDAHDRPIGGPSRPTTDRSPAATAALPTVRVDPRDPPRRSCAIAHAPLTHLSALTQTIVGVALTRRVDVNGRAFRTCAVAVFRLGGVQLRAAVLTDAAGPHRTAAPLPGASPIPGHLGASTASGNLTARRIGTAWLVVFGQDPDRRRRLLDALTITPPRA